MKKVALALAFILTVSAGFSQQRKRMAKANNMTPEQHATLLVKRMALQLDLTKVQTRKITALYTDMAKQRKVKGDKMRKEAEASKSKLAKNKKQNIRKKRRPRADFETANAALDNRIAFQAKMKKILTPEQYEKFTKLQKRRVKGAKKKMLAKKKMGKKKKMRKRRKGKR
jgi:Spy/CpxP family protein refolding chaperone